MAENEILINYPTWGPHDAVIRQNGWAVVNAPRPLPGEVWWTGDFAHGTFYAAGPREKYGREWDGLDAWPVRLVTNLDMMEILREKAERDGISLAEAVEDWGGIDALAAACHLPWRPEGCKWSPWAGEEAQS